MNQRIASLRLLATYNKIMNLQVYEAASKLSIEDLRLDRQAFFASILGTLNHLVVGDTIWLKRFSQQDRHQQSLMPIKKLQLPTALNQILFSDLDLLAQHRKMLDDLIVRWMDELSEGDLDNRLSYINTKGVKSTKIVFDVLLHFFNHQTHHRGQLSTLLFQAGVDIGATDLIALMPIQES